MDLETVFFIYKPVSFWPWLYLQCCNRNQFLWSFRELPLIQFVIVSADIYISNFLYDLLGVSCLSQKIIVPDFFVWSGGAYFVLWNLLSLRCPFMVQHHLHVFLVDYMYVQYSLILGVFYLWLRSPVDYLGEQFSLNSVFLLYQATFKLVNK